MDQLLKSITDAYGPALSFKQKVDKGFLSDNYVLVDSDGKQYFLKKYRFVNRDKIAEIHEVKKFFAAGGIPVILPINNVSGGSFVESGGCFYALFPFVVGRHLESVQLTDVTVISLAQTLAKMHLLGRNANVAVNNFFEGWSKDGSLLKVTQILSKLSEIKDKSDFDIRMEKHLLLKKSFIENNHKSYESFGFHNDHLLHGDYSVSNVFFDESGQVFFVFDFEMTVCAPRFYELFRAMMISVFGDGEINTKSLFLAKLFLASYLSIYPMSHEELERGLRAYCIRTFYSMWIEGEHYLKGNNRVDDLFRPNEIRTQYFSNDFELFIKNILS